MFNSRQLLKNIQGTTLIELVIALGVLVIVGVAMNSLMVNIHREYSLVAERTAQETESLHLSFYLKHFLSSAVNIESVPDVSVGGFSNLQGKISPYKLSSTWTPTMGIGASEPIALFYRDTLKSADTSNPPAGQRFLPTGFFFVRPTVDHYGVIGFDLGTPGAPFVKGDNGKQWRFTNIVDLEIDNLVLDNTLGPSISRVASLTITFTKRVYKVTARRDLKWCPPSQMSHALCQTNLPYWDIRKSVNVFFRNNVLGWSTVRRRVDGSPEKYVPAQRRIVDGVYFLRPELPVEAVKR